MRRREKGEKGKEKLLDSVNKFSLFAFFPLLAILKEVFETPSNP
jgi:hypothetical protein